MNGVALKINAVVQMEAERALPKVTALSAGWGVTIAYRGKLFPGRILACEKPIEQGQTGEATIGVIATSRDDVEMRVGSVFELKDGFTNTVATATALTVAYES